MSPSELKYFERKTDREAPSKEAYMTQAREECVKASVLRRVLRRHASEMQEVRTSLGEALQAVRDELELLRLVNHDVHHLKVLTGALMLCISEGVEALREHVKERDAQ